LAASPSPPRRAAAAAVIYEATFSTTTTRRETTRFDAGYQHRHAAWFEPRRAATRHGAASRCQSAGDTARELARRPYMRGLNPSHYGPCKLRQFRGRVVDADPGARRPEPPDRSSLPGLKGLANVPSGRHRAAAASTI
uniref:Os01g0778700 protein n=1 Tax=Macrostomum lignano TaxID=282301 RepID=A0A1I8FJ63_9PLAT